MGQEKSTKLCRAWIGDDGICHLDWVPKAEVTLKEAQEVMAAYNAIRQDKRLPLLIDTSQMKSFSREARQYYASDEAVAVASAAAIVVGTPVSRVLGNFYIGLSNPRLPSRLFTSTDEAVAWLKGFVT